MNGTLTIDNDGFGYSVHYSYNNEKEVVEMYFPGKGFAFSRENENFPESVLLYITEELLWSDSMIQTFENMIYSNVWVNKGFLKFNGHIE
jgi:hypothetical protein